MNYFVILGPDGWPLSDLDTGREFRFCTREEAEVFRTLNRGATVAERHKL